MTRPSALLAARRLGSRRPAVPTAADSPRRPWGEPGPSALPALDGLRALAVLGVVVTHVGFNTGSLQRDPLGGVAARLDVGVTLFFLLSGFLLYRPFVTAHFAHRPAPRLGPYLRNRALRILPAYWVFVLVVMPVFNSEQATVPEVVRQLLLLQTATVYHLLGEMTQTWSLVVEVGFYAVLPLLALAARPRSPRTPTAQLRAEAAVLSAMVLAALAWNVAVHGPGLLDERVTSLWLPGYLDWFALGMGLAVLRTWREATGRGDAVRQVASAAGTCWALAVLLLCLVSTPLAGPRGLVEPTLWEALVRHWLYGLVALFLVLPVVLGGDSPISRALSTRPARYVGRVSYGVFLWHLVALWLAFRVTGVPSFEGRFWLVLGVTLPLSLLLAHVSLRVVEEPALRRKVPSLPGG